jgi:Glyoxalase-like domain
VHLDVWVDDLDAAVAYVEQLGGRHTGEVTRNRKGSTSS